MRSIARSKKKLCPPPPSGHTRVVTRVLENIHVPRSLVSKEIYQLQICNAYMYILGQGSSYMAWVYCMLNKSA